MIRHKRHFFRYHPYQKRKHANVTESKIRNKTVLFPMQEIACDALDTYRKSEVWHTYLCLGTGLGKTLVVMHHAQKWGWRMLYLCPSSVMDHIKKQARTHFPGIRISFAPNFNRRSHINLISYQQLARLRENDILFNITFSTCVFDEVHTISNCTKKTSENIKKIHARFFIGVSATLQKRHIYCFDSETPIIFQPAATVKDSSLFLHKYEYATLTEQQTLLYESEVKKLQLCNYHTPMLILNPMRKFLSDLKVPLVVSWLMANCKNRKLKICICSDSQGALFSLATQLPTGTFVRVDSSVPKQARTQQLEKFESEHDGISILLATQKCIGCGIDLGFVDILIQLEPTFRKDQTTQLAGRIRRIGQQPRNLEKQEVVEFVFKNTCEEQLLKSQLVTSGLS